MKRLSVILIAIAVGWGTFSLADFAGSGFSGPHFTHGTLTDTKCCIYTAGTGIVCNSEGGATGLDNSTMDNTVLRRIHLR